jgi:hypothetical protein
MHTSRFIVGRKAITISLCKYVANKSRPVKKIAVALFVSVNLVCDHISVHACFITGF